MSTDTSAGSDSVPAPEDVAELQSRVEELETELADLQTEVGDEPKKMVIIATKGTLDMAYPPLILASTAAAFGYDVTVFHTFWGLEILHEENSKDLQLSSVGNPNMPVPNAIAALPGMDRMTTRMMRSKIADNDVASVEDL
ncbi:MAG: DsrE/DsrF/DrsH-like family protein, partial [Natronomonas sp.]